MIKQVYSQRLKRNVYRLDTRLSNGIRFRKFFLKRSDAEAVAYKIKHDASTRRFGLSITLDRPILSELARRYADDIQNSRERTRAKRVLADFCKLLVPDLCVDEVTKADCKKYIDKRKHDGLKPQSIDRELNIIVAMFNQAENYFPASSNGGLRACLGQRYWTAGENELGANMKSKSSWANSSRPSGMTSKLSRQ